MPAKLYATDVSPPTLLASVERVELAADTRTDGRVYGGADSAWTERGPILEATLTIIVTGRIDAGAQMNVIRPRIAQEAQPYRLVYQDGASWQGNFVIGGLREEEPGGQEARFTLRLQSHGEPTYSAS